jgi:hypothetical protein
MSDQGPGWGDPTQGPTGPTGPPGPPGPAPPPPSYQYQYPGGYQPAQTDGMAIAALVVAICSFVVVWFIPVVPAIIALVLANSSNKKIRESGGRLTGETLNRVAIIISWINLGIWIAVILLIIILIIVSASSSAALGGSG